MYGILYWSYFSVFFLVRFLLNVARPKLLLCLSWTVENDRNVLSWPTVGNAYHKYFHFQKTNNRSSKHLNTTTNDHISYSLGVNKIQGCSMLNGKIFCKSNLLTDRQLEPVNTIWTNVSAVIKLKTGWNSFWSVRSNIKQDVNVYQRTGCFVRCSHNASAWGRELNVPTSPSVIDLHRLVGQISTPKNRYKHFQLITINFKLV